VVGAKRGPAPAHDIGIWLGAYKPRMLALTGRPADGWLPSQSYLKDGDLATGNAVIDDAAQSAGRSSRDIRRLLNISGEFLRSARGPLQGRPSSGRRSSPTSPSPTASVRSSSAALVEPLARLGG